MKYVLFPHFYNAKYAFVMGLGCIPQIHTLKSSPLVLRNLILLGNRVFTEKIKLK